MHPFSSTKGEGINKGKERKNKACRSSTFTLHTRQRHMLIIAALINLPVDFGDKIKVD